MDEASIALGETRYFDTVSLCLRAIERARATSDLDRLSRISLPLQEARRQIRQLAVDAGPVRLISSSEDLPKPLEPGCYLFQPPMIGADARTLRQMAHKRKIPVFAFAREPLTTGGRWPVVGVGEVSVRTQVDPPEVLMRVDDHVTKDRFKGEVPMDWFEAAAEAVGDAGIASLKPDHSPWWRLDDLLERLSAVPEHEKLHQALAATCREAMEADQPIERRPHPLDNPYSF